MYQRINHSVKSALKQFGNSRSRKTKTSPQVVVLGKRNPLIIFFHHTMMVLGVAAITALSIMFIKPHLTDEFRAISPFVKAGQTVQASTSQTLPALATEVAPTQTGNPKEPQIAHTKQQQSVTNWLSKRYRVANGAATMLVSAAYSTAKDLKLDPLLILSVMAIESGLNPFAESAVGAQGLMQVMFKVHQDKFEVLGGAKAALEPAANIRVGAQILKEYVTRGGSVEAGLKLYVGAALSGNDGGYGNKVIAEYQRLKDVSNGKYVPIFNTTTTASAKPAVKTVNTQVTQISENENLIDKIKVDHVEPESLAAI